MLRLVIQKMRHSSWMVICLAIGSILAVALISSIPMYTGGILQRMLVKDLESFQEKRYTYPGNISAQYYFYNPQGDPRRWDFYQTINDQIENDLIPSLGLPVDNHSVIGIFDYIRVLDIGDIEREKPRSSLRITSLKGVNDRITLKKGRLFSSERDADGIYEMIVTEETMVKHDLVIDRIYDIQSLVSDEFLFKAKIVGIYNFKEGGDTFWYRPTSTYTSSLLMDFSLFERDFIEDFAPNLSKVVWHYALDYHEMKAERLPAFLNVIRRYERLTAANKIELTFKVLPIFEEYEQRAKTLKLMLLFLQTPVMLMLIFFIYMVSQLVIENERNEIAVLKSRGASGSQVFQIYLIESFIIGGFALIVGPLFGFWICRVLGASNGFMTFIQRTSLPVRLSGQAYLYALGGFAIFVMTMLAPLIVYTRSTIIEYKREMVRNTKAPFWKRFYFDIILIGLSMYGLYSYWNQQEILEITGVVGSNLPVDPLLFTITVLFVLGAGLLTLRLFPIFVRFIFMIGRKTWKPEAYAAILHVGRSSGTQQFLMIFIILSLSIGMFNSISARTINQHMEERIFYRNGSDITLESQWEQMDAAGNFVSDDAGGMMGGPPSSSSSSAKLRWVEPSYKPYEELVGVERVTKVFRKDRATAQLPGRKSTVVDLMALIPHEFGQTAWLKRSDLVPYHWNDYLNLLASQPKAVLVSSNLRDAFDLKLGDSILISWSGQGSFEGAIFAFVDYWPGFNPQDYIGTGGRITGFAVANLNLIQAKMAMEPYQVWAKKEKNVATKVVYDDIAEKGLKILKAIDSDQELISAKNDPLLQGANGVLTLGFMVSMAISVAGFVIYWILSLKARILEFGIVRAMGLPKRKVTLMLIWEHLLLTGTAVVIGITVGRLAASIFVPLLQIVYSAEEQVPPFKVAAHTSDFIQIYAIAALMLISGIAMFRLIVSKLNVHQALKLGEE